VQVSQQRRLAQADVTQDRGEPLPVLDGPSNSEYSRL
jgi:hypothetical protein